MTLIHYIIPKLLNAKENYYKDAFGIGFSDYLLLVQKINTTEYIEKNNIVQNITKTFFYNFLNYNLQSHISILELISYINSSFLSECDKQAYLMYVNKYMKTINGFRRLKLLYENKFYPTRFNIELESMNELDINHKHTICIIQEKSKYYYKIQDIIKIINNRLCHSPNFFCNSLAILNPYTNIPFNKSTLYNIYFFIKNKTMIKSELFEIFFNENFELFSFKEKHASTIITHYVKSFVKNIENDHLLRGIKRMIKFINRCINKEHKILLSDDFPINIILTAFRPYYELFLNFMYCNDSQQKYNYKHMFLYKIEKFIMFNPFFGRTKIKVIRGDNNTIIQKQSIPIRSNFIPFNTKNDIQVHKFLNNHIREYKPREYFWTSEFFDESDSFSSRTDIFSRVFTSVRLPIHSYLSSDEESSQHSDSDNSNDESNAEELNIDNTDDNMSIESLDNDTNNNIV